MNRKPFRIDALLGSAALLLVVLAGTAPGVVAETPRGRLAGGQAYDLPPWFKKSFLAVREDVGEARAHGRHVMLFMHLKECPYCARILDENFRTGETREFIQKHFDAIGIDIRGQAPVEWLDGRTYTEQELAQATKVVATPTLLFLNADGKVVLRLNGYRQPPAFRQALEYVQGRYYEKETLASFVEKQNKQAVYRFRADPKFVDMTNFKGHQKPLAMIFEDKDCADCGEFYTKVFSHPQVQRELDEFTVVRLDAYSTAPIVDLDGHRTTPKDWAQRLNLVYRPGMVLFNEGRERARMDGMLYRFHFKELLRYVSGKYYRQYATKSQYNAARREELLKQGVVIDYSQ